MLSYNLETGIREVWAQDSEFQKACIEGIVKNIRNIKNDKILKLHTDYLVDQGAFFVHNDQYMIDRFGEFIKDPALGIYRYDCCSLAGRLAIPLRYMDGTVKGFIGYSKKPANLVGDNSFIKYLYPPKEAFTKARYMYMMADEYKKAVEDGYVCIVDGIFDKIVLQCLGINAVSLCGSALTKWHRYYLHFIKHKIVIADNDTAGRNLAAKCKRYLADCVEIQQASQNDIDAFLRTDEAVNEFMNCFEQMKSEGFILSHRLNKIKEDKHEKEGI